jgi:hypothetical protein
MPCRLSSCSNSVSPRHAVYCRPWSVSTSCGVPYAAMPRASASITSVDRWLCASAHDTRKREWSSMKAVRYSRSWRRKRNVKMSDCHIWLGAARSKRLGPCSRAAVGSRASRRPASCRIPRTCVSLTPSPSKRASTSRMRRVPYSGCCSRSPTTASCLACAATVCRRGGGFGGLGTSASTPPLSYAFTQLTIAVTLGPKSRDSLPRLTPPPSACSTTRSRSTNGYALPRPVSSPGLPPPCSGALRPPPLPLRLLMTVSPFPSPLSAGMGGTVLGDFERDQTLT